jgi:tRNA (Thr-GGU) A37 N-methylase
MAKLAIMQARMRNLAMIVPDTMQALYAMGASATKGSPDRPNPLGLHRATVLAIDQGCLLIGPIEAIDGTPVVDIKAVISRADG